MYTAMTIMGTASPLTLNSDVNRSECNTDSLIGVLQKENAGVLSSLRCPHSTECEVTGDIVTTSGGGSCSWGVSRPRPPEY